MAEISIRTDWAELDLYGHINNVAYYRYMQSARIAFCEQVGLTALNEPGKLSFILASSNCNYRRKLFYPDEVVVRSVITGIHNSSFHLQHSIYNGAGELCADGTDVLVLYDYAANTKVSISPSFRNLLDSHR